LNLTVARDNVIDFLQENLSIVAGGKPVKVLGEVFEDIASEFQALGICNLLTTAEPAGFFRNLILSGFTRRYFLRRSRTEGNVAGEHLAISRTMSVFDCLAAGALDLALEIVQLSPADWFPDGEYEDDFAYHRFFHLYIQGFQKAGRQPLMEVLAQFERALEGNESPRLKICHSVLAADAVKFAEAFEELLQEREQQMKVRRKLGGDDPTIEPCSAVFVEGLALLWIADRIALPTEPEYPFCQSVGRAPPKPALPNDLYVDVDKVIREAASEG
jgi:hypothetical protein